MHFICRSFIGSPTDSNWSQYWENEPDDPQVIDSKGHLFGLINLKSDNESKEISSLGHDIISEINQYYFFHEKELPIIDRLKETLLFISTNPLYQDVKFSIFLAVILHDHVHFGLYGEGEIILNRFPKISRILSGKTNSVSVLSGPIFVKDKILFATDLFYQKFSWEKIKTILADDKIQNIEENFISSLYSFDDQIGLAAALIQLEPDDETEVAKPVKTIVETTEEFPQIKENKKVDFDFFKKIFSKKPVYVTHHEVGQISKRKKINLIIAVFLLLGLGVSSFLGYKKNQASHIESSYQQLKQDLDKKLSDAFAIKNLNFDSALDLAKQSQSVYEKLVKLKVHSSELSNYDEKIKSLLSQTGGNNNLHSNTFYNTSVIIDNPKFSKIILKDNLLYLLDSINGRIDAVDINQKNTKNIATNEKIKNTLNFVDNNDSLYLIDNKTISLVSKDNVETKIDFSQMNKNIVPVDLQSWNSAFYLLDSSNSTIWKFNPSANTFGSGQIWLKDGQSLPSNPSSLAINGNIWVLSDNGQIALFVLGIKENFKLSQPPQFTKTKNLVVGIDNGILAFVDNDNTVFVYKKTGEQLAKYNLNNKKILDLALSEKSNSIFVLCDDEKIYKISL